MSGHNKWSKIKRKKESADKEKSKLYSKHISAISNLARKNPSPETNSELKSAIEEALNNNVPKDNIENALKKAEKTSSNLEELRIEAYGPSGVAILITAETDNKNRTLQQIKAILNESSDSKWADPGSVLWAFEQIDDIWKPKFPQELERKDSEKLNNLIIKIKENPDVISVYTNAKQ